MKTCNKKQKKKKKKKKKKNQIKKKKKTITSPIFNAQRPNFTNFRSKSKSQRRRRRERKKIMSQIKYNQPFKQDLENWNQTYHQLLSQQGAKCSKCNVVVECSLELVLHCHLLFGNSLLCIPCHELEHQQDDLFGAPCQFMSTKPLHLIGDDIKVRDTRLRKMILTHNQQCLDYNEVGLAKRAVMDPDILRYWPFVYEYEYEVYPHYSNLGKGDLIMTNGVNNFVVIELKYLPVDSGRSARVKRNAKRKEVEEQAIKYFQEFKRKMNLRLMNSECKIFAAIYTNEPFSTSFRIIDES